MGFLSWLFGSDSKEAQPKSARSGKKKARKKSLKKKLYIGMTYTDLVALLGEPSCSTGGDLLLGGPFAMSDDIRGKLAKSVFYKWSRPEGDYDLTILDGRLSNITSVPD